ncbi:MAG: hypothetical protein KGJ29_11110, partial [Hyphomicrobiales bacterium]|nr:hypothetical protein [Hyphomicrobiales bacterium]
SFPERPDVKYFFKLFTLFWAAYFFLKAALYLWLGAVLPLEQALAWRALLGGVSLAIMGGLSLMGRKLFFFCRWLNILPQANAAGATQADN